ncbi:reverse transcriptase domain-containing protein [Tanacetum coccineum]
MRCLRGYHCTRFDPLVVPEVGILWSHPPTGVLDLVNYSSSDSDPSEDSLPPTRVTLVFTLLCSVYSGRRTSESEHAEQRPERHRCLSPFVYVMVLSFSLLLLLPHPRFVNGQRFLSDPGRLSISIDLTAPILTGDTSSGSPSDSLSDTSSVHSSGCDASGQTHSGSSTRVAQSRVIPRFISERSLDSSSLSAGPSRKICRSPTTSVPSSNPALYGDWYCDAEAVADLCIGDGVGAHTKDGICMGVEIAASDIREDEEEFEAETSAGGTMEIDVDPLVTSGISGSTRGDVPDLEDTLYDTVHYMSEVPLDEITEFETTQRQLEVGQLMASGERARLTNRIRRLGRENLRVRALLCIKRDRVDSLRHHMELSQEKFCQIRRDHDDDQRRLRRLESFDMTITRSGMTLEAIKELISHQNGNDGDNGNSRNGNRNHRDGGNNGNGNPNANVEVICQLLVLMDKKLKGYAIRSAENKRKFVSNQRDNRAQQTPFKRQIVGGSNVAKAYTAGGNEGRVYVGPHPLCNKCKLHHVGPCTVKCRSCGKIGHLTRDCKPAVPTTVN